MMANNNVFDPETSNLTRPLAIEASAGTGKTHNICEIVKRLVFEGEKPLKLDEILIVTYTDKATEELKNRIRKAILEVDPNYKINNMNVFTIHSFCQSVISEFGIIANLPLDLETAQEKELLDEFLDIFLRDEESIKKNIVVLEEICKEFKFSTLKANLKDTIMNYYLSYDNKIDKSIISIKGHDEYDFGKVEKVVTAKRHQNAFEYLCSNDAEFKNKYDLMNKSEEGSKAKDFACAIVKKINNNEKYDGRKYNSGTNWDKKSESHRLDLKESFKYLEEYKTIIDSHFYEFFIRKFINNIYIGYQEFKAKRKVQTFNDMLRNVRESLLRNEMLVEKLQAKYKYAIIDEFQDTNKLQYDIFSKIFLNVKDHNLIVVGDPKQSIYAFQGADLYVYQEAVNEINNKEILVYNYRSCKGMVDSCNKYFGNGFFDDVIGFNDSKTPDVKKELKALYKGKEIKSFWVVGDSEKPTTPSEYAKVIIQKIVDFTKKEDGKNTNLQLIDVTKKGKAKKVENVNFSSFCILYRARSETPDIINELNRCGIPSVRYKDKDLLDGRECRNFITILKAIDAVDFSGKRRGLFKAALFSDFFGKKLEEVNSTEYEHDDSKEMELIFGWKQLAHEGRYEELIDSIINDSSLLKNLKDLSNNKTIGKYIQLADSSIDYLYNNHTISDLIRYLESGAKGSSDEDGSTTEIGTDLDAVKLMTIHSSKGLEFPVCFFCGGYKKAKSQNVVVYHDKETKERLISFVGSDFEEERNDEWKRLIYVGFTRAKYLLMIPYYQGKEKKNPKDDKKKDKETYMSILNKATDNYQKNYNSDYEKVECVNLDYNELKNDVKEILKSKNSNLSVEGKEKQDKKIQKLVRCKWKIGTFKRSYSSLSHGHEEDDSEERDKEGSEVYSTLDADKDAKAFFGVLNSEIGYIEEPEKFPKGDKIGSALHEIFEKSTFTDYVSDKYNEDKLNGLITDTLEKNDVRIKDNLKDDCLKYIRGMVFNVLNSDLVEIKGSDKTGKTFKLSSINNDDKLAETEFNFNLKNEKLRNYCNGFIDLVFRRENHYSILDWKSDSINDDDLKNYGVEEDLIKHTASRYSIQRVLYSYCLIKYLSEVLGKTKEEVFKENFGGIYYVYLRGCIKDLSNGIYAQSWDSYETLEKAFNDIITEKIGGNHES